MLGEKVRSAWVDARTCNHGGCDQVFQGSRAKERVERIVQREYVDNVEQVIASEWVLLFVVSDKR
jgi:hypothetical protein